jgi:TonB family protein
VKASRVSRGVPPFIGTLLSLAFIVSLSSVLQAQSSSEPEKSAGATQTRIERARALIAAHQLETAASELESVRATHQDDSVRHVTSVMLMSIYLEAGNYGRAEALLEEAFKARAAQKNDSIYFALAGQAVNGGRTHLARYRSFGISITDVDLPAEAVNDLDRLRSLLERMIAQAKEISTQRKAYDSLSLLEDVLGLRLSLAKDNEDQAKWDSEYASAREVQASSQTQIASLGAVPNLPPKSRNTPASSPKSNPETLASRGAVSGKHSASDDAVITSPPSTQPKIESDKPAPDSKPADEAKTLNAGSLNAKATKKVVPVYPPLAKQSRAAGMVRVYVVVDETGKVIEVSRSVGPVLLRRAAEDAARQWAFSAIYGVENAVRFSGFIDFNFTL